MELYVSQNQFLLGKGTSIQNLPLQVPICNAYRIYSVNNLIKCKVLLSYMLSITGVDVDDPLGLLGRSIKRR